MLLTWCVQDSLALVNQQDHDSGPQVTDNDGISTDDAPEMNFTEEDFPTIATASGSQPGTSSGGGGGRWAVAGK